MKGFIEVKIKSNIKASINIKHIVIFKDKKIRLNSDKYAIEIEESYEEIKELIKNAQ